MPVDLVAWDRFEWRTGADRYQFEIQDQGLVGRLNLSDGRSYALPMVVWEAVFDAVKINRRAKQKSDSHLPKRAGARWSEAESDELAAKFRSGRSIDALAQEHARTNWSIEAQLGKLGLWDRIERRAVAAPIQAVPGPHASISPRSSTPPSLSGPSSTWASSQPNRG
ncbi:MAG: hypothetical protein ABL907_20670 [Hyphomicrobium sp.]